ncbi:S26 family signal peptidase [Streptomyces racemochromogenes]|uniref:S26 family signal peptidase n=1 Tax=Streptomyces racemochromogenes TaxID=67353 RepID=UPI00376FF54B
MLCRGATYSASAMEPTRSEGDLLLFRKGPAEVRRGDVVLVTTGPMDGGADPRRPVVERAVAVGGDTPRVREATTGTVVVTQQGTCSPPPIDDRPGPVSAFAARATVVTGEGDGGPGRPRRQRATRRTRRDDLGRAPSGPKIYFRHTA